MNTNNGRIDDSCWHNNKVEVDRGNKASNVVDSILHNIKDIKNKVKHKYYVRNSINKEIKVILIVNPLISNKLNDKKKYNNL